MGAGRFWMGGPVHVVNGFRRPFMGQTPTPSNRLLGIPVKTILSRWILALKPPNVTLENWKMRNNDGPFSPFYTATWTDGDVQLLSDIEKSPTPEEISDLSLIDGFFLPPTRDTYPDSEQGPEYVQAGGTGMIKDIFCPPSSMTDDQTRKLTVLRNSLYEFILGRHCRTLQYPGGTVCPTGSPVEGSEKNPFFCPPVTVHYSRNLPVGPFRGASGDDLFMTLAKQNYYFSGLPGDFKINIDDPWGMSKLAVQNALVLMDALKDYPFPSPIALRPSYWYVTAATEAIALVHGKVPIDREFARFWITLSVMDHYDEASDLLFTELKKEARQERTDKLIQKIGIAVILTAMSAGFAAAAIPALIATGVNTALSTGISLLDIQERKDAATSMAQASQLFEKSDPAFAVELDKASKTLDAQAAQAAASMGPPPGSQAFEEEQAKLSTDLGLTKPGSIGEYVVGGGVAAGLIAAVVALFR